MVLTTPFKQDSFVFISSNPNKMNYNTPPMKAHSHVTSHSHVSSHDHVTSHAHVTSHTHSWCNIVLGSGIIENEDHFLNHCDLNAASRRKVLDKINSHIISNPNTPSATSYPFHTVIPGSNVLKLISKNSEIIESITNGNQVHLTRVVARFATYSTTCINNRKKFVDSLASTI